MIPTIKKAPSSGPHQAAQLVPGLRGSDRTAGPCYISNEVEAVTGPMPIINATAATLRTAVESLLDDRAHGAGIAA